jgi:hypothetical protein
MGFSINSAMNVFSRNWSLRCVGAVVNADEPVVSQLATRAVEFSSARDYLGRRRS